MSAIQILIAVGVVLYYIVRAMNKKDDTPQRKAPARRQAPSTTSRPSTTASGSGETSLEDIFREFLEQENEGQSTTSTYKPSSSTQTAQYRAEESTGPIESTLQRKSSTVEHHSSTVEHNLLDDTSKSSAYDYEGEGAKLRQKLEESKRQREKAMAKYGGKVSDEESPIYNKPATAGDFDLRQAIIGQMILERKYT